MTKTLPRTGVLEFDPPRRELDTRICGDVGSALGAIRNSAKLLFCLRHEKIRKGGQEAVVQVNQMSVGPAIKGTVVDVRMGIGPKRLESKKEGVNVTKARRSAVPNR